MASRRRSGETREQQCSVVAGRRRAAESGDIAPDRLQCLIKWALMTALERVLESLQAEKLAVRVTRFGETVGVQSHGVACCELDLVFGILQSRAHAECRAARGHLAHACRAADEDGIVAAAGSA